MTLMLHTIARDLRFALRMLGKSPVFTVVAALVITLGTGAVTTIFSAANAIALRPLPAVPDADRLVEVKRTMGDGRGSLSASYPYYTRLRDGAHSTDGIAAWSMLPLTISTGGEGMSSLGNIVSGNYFTVMGVRPALGRFFTPDEDAPGAPSVVVVSHAFWTDRLGADSGVVGRTIRLNGHVFTVIGVAPPKFRGVFTPLRTDAWVPLALQPVLRAGGDLTSAGAAWLEVFARMRAGVAPEAAREELSRLSASFVAESGEPPQFREYTAARVATLSGLPSEVHGAVLGFMGLLLAASGLVLLIASLNVSAMLLARAVARRRETAVRLALGASRGRLVGQLLTESVLLYALGAAGGIVLAVNATRLLATIPLPTDVPFALDLSPDLRVLAFTLVVSLATGVLFGLAPALQSARVDINARLRNDTAGSGARRSRARNALIAAQMAFSLLLLVTAGLFLRALDRGQRVDPGFDTANVAVAAFDVSTYGYDDARARQFYQTLKERMAAEPGVSAVSYTRMLPLSMNNMGDEFVVDGSAVAAPSERGVPLGFAEVDAGYFDVTRIPLLSGRDFASTDDARAPRVAIVNQTMATRFWPNGSAVGRTLRRGDQVIAVVGVVRDAKYGTLSETPQPYVYFPTAQERSSTNLLVRTAGDPARLAGAIREAVRAFDPMLPAPNVTTLSAATSVVLLPQRVAAAVTAVLGGVGLLLAAVGLYGIVAYSVGQRTREIGVRMALGAASRDVLALVVREGVRPVFVGMAIGLVLAVGTTRLLASFLLGVSPLDALTFAGVAALLTLVAVAASYIPARRAAATEPVRALSND